MNNFSWQFDPAMFERMIDPRGITSGHNLSMNLATFAKNTVQQAYSGQKSGVVPGSVLPAKDIQSFVELLALVVDKKQELEGINKQDRIEVRAKKVNTKPERDVIGWDLKKRQPGLFAQGKPGSDRVQEYSMHLRAVYDDPNNPGHDIAAFGRKMDNWISLTVMSTDIDSADNYAIWLEDTMEEARWLFQYNGFERVLFIKREADEFEEVQGNPVYKRPLIYYIRTEKVVLHRVALLRKLIFDLCITPPGKLISEDARLNEVFTKK